MQVQAPVVAWDVEEVSLPFPLGSGRATRMDRAPSRYIGQVVGVTPERHGEAWVVEVGEAPDGVLRYSTRTAGFAQPPGIEHGGTASCSTVAVIRRRQRFVGAGVAGVVPLVESRSLCGPSTWASMRPMLMCTTVSQASSVAGRWAMAMMVI